MTFLPKIKKELGPYPCFFYSHSIAFLLVLLVCFIESATPKSESGNIGAIVDNSSSRMGKEAKVAMEIAIHDFNTQTTTNQSLLLCLHIPIISKQSKPIQAALAGNLDGQEIIEKISSTDFNGLTGKIRFNGRKLAPSHTFQIVNVIGKSYRELGFWTEGRGFSESIDQTVFYNSSMQVLGQVFWPGGPWYTPKGWTVSTEIERLRIGVPTGSTFKQFANVEYDDRTKQFSFTGFSIEYAEFTEPYTESGLVMIVPVQSQTNRALLFMKPFTTDMWILIMAINIYNGFVVWLIERNHCPELQGSVTDQIGTLLWLAFTTLFSLHGEKLHSNLSRMAMVVWLFVALVITQSYTASLTSMLTVQQLQPATRNIETLKNSNAKVGHGKGSYVSTYLKDVLGFKSTNLKNFSSPKNMLERSRVEK
ncbi:hypothetical protein ACSBR2_011568 [Camellia fascicularis]